MCLPGFPFSDVLPAPGASFRLRAASGGKEMARNSSGPFREFKQRQTYWLIARGLLCCAMTSLA